MPNLLMLGRRYEAYVTVLEGRRASRWFTSIPGREAAWAESQRRRRRRI